MRNIYFIATLLMALLLSCSNPKNEHTVLWVSSSPSAQWQVDSLSLNTISADNNSTVRIFSDSLLQTIDGFGACFNELGWEALNMLTEDERKNILNSIFNPEDGCKFNLCRMPIGANDYAVDWYSHNETDGDFKMANFSIERDLQRLVPYIKQAKSINPNIKIWGSPWCPPSWMKVNSHYACKPDSVNDLPEEGRGEELSSQFIMEDKYLDAYALYFSKFIQEYQKQGIDIYGVHVQNEPNSCQNFPSCVWRPEDLARFIGDHLGPQLQQDMLDTEIWLGTIERPQIERVNTILQDKQANKYITGVGFQWAGKGAIPEVHDKYPNLKLMQTETECGDGSNDWKAAEYTFSLMKHYFSNGASAYLYWNMVLDETGKSQWGWKQNSMISIDKQTQEISYNPEFYLMKHFSAYIKTGAKYIKTSDENCLAFKNPNEYVIFYYNEKDNNELREFKVDDKTFSTQLKPKSFNTYVVKL